MLASFIVIAFLTGGSARGDVWSLVVLRPLAVLVAGFAILHLRLGSLRDYRWGALLALACVLLPVLQLLPLPPELWHHLPGRALIADIDAAAGRPDRYRSLSIAPIETWNALSSLSVPLAVFLLGMCLSYAERRALLGVILMCGLTAAVFGVLQITGAGGQLLYLYNVTNDGGAVGVFANRNHQAVFLALLYPLMAVYCGGDAKVNRGKILFCIGLGICLVPLILVTGSRAGLISAAIGITLSLALLRSGPTAAGARRRAKPAWIMLTTIFVAITLLVLFALPRAEAVRRLLATNETDDASRSAIWRTTWSTAKHFGLLGSGAGTFVPAYQVYEPSYLLTPEYTNHAHNDYLEIALTGGLPAAMILAAGLALWAVFALRWLRDRSASNESRYARLGVIVIFMLGVASGVDYPLRVPFISCVFVCAGLWLVGRSPRLPIEI